MDVVVEVVDGTEEMLECKNANIVGHVDCVVTMERNVEILCRDINQKQHWIIAWRK